MYTSRVPKEANNMLPKPPEWGNVSPAVFESEVVPLYKPAVFRGLVRDWPAVHRNAESVASLLEYLLTLDSEQAVYTVVGDPSINGRFFYDEQFQGVNYGIVGAALRSTIEHLVRARKLPKPPAIAVQAANVNDALPGFTAENPLPLLGSESEPTFWLGNRAVVAPHFDVKDNIACV
ncbi:MAG: hypothetical protein ACJARU_002100, partial [Congregibacter sp.]